MPLTEDQVRERATMGTDQRQAMDVSRIAEALEAMVPALRKIEEHLEMIRTRT